jgi:hypothetical protein
MELFMNKSVFLFVILIVRLSDMDFLAVVTCLEKINLSQSLFNCVYYFPFYLKCLFLKTLEGDSEGDEVFCLVKLNFIIK